MEYLTGFKDSCRIDRSGLRTYIKTEFGEKLMAYTYLEVIEHIGRGEFSSCYLLFGQERYLIRELKERLVDKLLPEEGRDLNLYRFSGESVSFVEVAGILNTPSFFGSNRVVVVELDKWTDLDEAGLLELCNGIHGGTLIITSPSVDKRVKAYKLLDKVGMIVECEPLKGKELENWVKENIKKEGKRISAAELGILISLLPNNLHLMQSELLKLFTYIGDREEITADDISEVVSGGQQAKIFDFVDAVAERKKQAAYNLLEGMLIQGESPYVLISLLIRQFRLIWQAKVYASMGMSPLEIQKELKVPSFVVNKALKQSQAFSLDDLPVILDTLMETDVGIKSGQWDARLAVERLLLELIG